MNLRDITSADFDTLIEIADACRLSPWSRRNFADELARKDSIMLVAEADGGEIAGFIIGRFQPGFPAGQPLEAEIYNIGVLEQFRVAGIGTKLFNEYVRRCRDAGVAAVWLEVRASNAPAIAFYKKNGFERHSVRPNFYADPAEDAVVMTAAI